MTILHEDVLILAAGIAVAALYYLTPLWPLTVVIGTFTCGHNLRQK